MKNKNKICKAKGCDREAVCKGYCPKHYQQIKLRGKLIEKNYLYVEGICKMIGCNGKILAKGLCQPHYLEDKKGEKNGS